MSNQLGRTFHGCLTCRKRKVRCKGGDPCSNCLRMRITCHGSFDDNIRMSFASSAGQKRKHSMTDGPPRQSSQNPHYVAGEDSYNTAPSASAQADVQFNDNESAVNEAPQREASQKSATRDQVSNPPLPPLTGDYSNLDFFSASDDWDFDFSFDNFWAHESTNLGVSGEILEQSTGNGFVNFKDPATSERSNNTGSATTGRAPDVAQDIESTSRNDNFYFQHYEESISSWAYSMKEDGKANYLRFIVDFIRGPNCTEDSPFRLAVLAWTAKHWQMISDDRDNAWETYHARAIAGIERLKSSSSNLPALSPSTQRESVVASRAEIIICSTLFLCRCDLLNDNVPSMRSLLNNLKEHLAEHLLDSKLSAFACQILLWLSYLHVRISIFSQPQSNSDTADTTLLHLVTHHPAYEYILSHSHLFVAEVLGKSYTEETDEQAQDVEKLPVSTRTHETFRLISKVLDFRSWRRSVERKGNAADRKELAAAKIDAIDLDIKRMEAEFALAMATNASASVMYLETAHDRAQIFSRPDTHLGATGLSLPDAILRGEQNSSTSSNSRAVLQWLSCYAVFLSVKLLWSRIQHPEQRSDSRNSHTVALILKIVLHMQQVHRKRASSTSPWLKIPRAMMWPLPLFMAGIETTDAIYADWIWKFMDEVSTSSSRVESTSSKAEKQANGGWISSVSGGKRAQALMMRVREAQQEWGCRVDVESIMNDMNGGNGVFVL